MSMWGRRGQELSGGNEESKRPGVSGTGDLPAGQGAASGSSTKLEPAPSAAAESKTASRLCKSVKFRGEIHSDEDLFVDGTVDGVIDIPNKMLVIGPNSEVRADIQARSLVLHGRLQGKVNIRERIEIKKQGRLDGDLVTHRLVIEDGAVFCGTSEAHPPKVESSGPSQAGAPDSSLLPGVKVESAKQPDRPPNPVRPAPKPSTA